MSKEQLTKIWVELPNHLEISGESMWAEYLGNNQYKIKNIPFYAYGLNYNDIVIAEAESEELKPVIKTLVKYSGHETIRVIFLQDQNKIESKNIIDSIIDDHIGYEGKNEIEFTLNVTPKGNYNSLYDELEKLEKNGILSFETCETRVENSFDDFPENG